MWKLLNIVANFSILLLENLGGLSGGGGVGGNGPFSPPPPHRARLWLVVRRGCPGVSLGPGARVCARLPWQHCLLSRNPGMNVHEVLSLFNSM